MKKIFKYIALAAIAATAAVSCRYGEDEISNPVDKAAEMTITIGEASQLHLQGRLLTTAIL